MATEESIKTQAGTETDVSIDVQGVSKGFGPFKAVQNLSFKVN